MDDTDDEHFTQAVALEIRVILARKGWSRERLAQESGIPLPTLQRYIAGKRQIPIPAFLKVLRALGVSLKDFGEAVDRGVNTSTKGASHD